jgi:MFS superfamily sulfate permease-like transporter
MLSGVFVLLAIFLLAEVINHTPIAALAVLLLVVAAGLIDMGHIRNILRSHNADRIAFASTVEVIKAAACHLQSEGRSLLLVGCTPMLHAYLRKTDTAVVVGEENLFPGMPGRWFAALEDVLEHAIEFVGEQPAAIAPCARG